MKLIRPALIYLSLVAIMVISSCSKNNPAPYSLISPSNNNTSVPVTQVFTCNNPGNIATYTFTFSDITSGNTRDITTIVNSTTATFTSGPASTLIPGHSYLWVVSYRTTDGGNATSPTWSFTVI